MAPVLYRPQPLPPSLLTELAAVSLNNRFAACVALTTDIWGHGVAGCASEEERTEWGNRLVEYLTMSRNAWASALGTRFVRGTVDVPVVSR
jgi:hypothetical protein